MLSALFFAASLASAAPIPTAATAESARERGHALYFGGDPAKALEAYGQAVKLSSTSARAWLDGAVVLEELGRRQDAVKWYAAASKLTSDAAVASALGWAQWRAGQLKDAAKSFALAIGRQPDEPYALLGQGRLELDAGQPKDALRDFQRAAAAAPLLNVVSYYEGQAYDKLGDPQKAADAYKQAVVGDSYFAEGREALGRLYLKGRNYNEAWRQFSRIQDAEPKNKKFAALLAKIQPMLTKRASQLRPTGLALPIPYLAPSPAAKAAPEIRVGLNTNPLGRPRPRQSLVFKVTTDFEILDAKDGKKIADGDGDDAYQLEVKRTKKGRQVVLTDSDRKAVAARKTGFVIRPKQEGIVALDPGAGPAAGAAGKLYRGRLEATLFRGQLRLVNIVDLENYIHGVAAAEMPIKSPAEALKAQAVVARTHALFIKKMTRRHKKEGYDVCDEQHCQVYAGARAESARSRDIVESTRGKVVMHKGKLALMIYSSNCGGHTQSGKDLAGWGDVPYWQGIYDGPGAPPDTRSPWALRRWLYTWPASYCKPSADVHASHFRWTRVMTWKDLEDKLNRKLKIGKLKTIRALRRSPSGNVNLLYVEGSKRKKKVDAEIEIRGLLGLGSLRSTQFVIDYEYDAKGKPTAVVFHGGGWGHGVGLCQSGAMGRADAGQDYEQIIKAYFHGVELGQLPY